MTSNNTVQVDFKLDSHAFVNLVAMDRLGITGVTRDKCREHFHHFEKSYWVRMASYKPFMLILVLLGMAMLLCFTVIVPLAAFFAIGAILCSRQWFYSQLRDRIFQKGQKLAKSLSEVDPLLQAIFSMSPRIEVSSLESIPTADVKVDLSFNQEVGFKLHPNFQVEPLNLSGIPPPADFEGTSHNKATSIHFKEPSLEDNDNVNLETDRKLIYYPGGVPEELPAGRPPKMNIIHGSDQGTISFGVRTPHSIHSPNVSHHKPPVAVYAVPLAESIVEHPLPRFASPFKGLGVNNPEVRLLQSSALGPRLSKSVPLGNESYQVGTLGTKTTNWVESDPHMFNNISGSMPNNAFTKPPSMYQVPVDLKDGSFGQHDPVAIDLGEAPEDSRNFEGLDVRISQHSWHRMNTSNHQAKKAALAATSSLYRNDGDDVPPILEYTEEEAFEYGRRLQGQAGYQLAQNYAQGAGDYSRASGYYDYGEIQQGVRGYDEGPRASFARKPQESWHGGVVDDQSRQINEAAFKPSEFQN